MSSHLVHLSISRLCLNSRAFPLLLILYKLRLQCVCHIATGSTVLLHLVLLVLLLHLLLLSQLKMLLLLEHRLVLVLRLLLLLLLLLVMAISSHWS